MKTLRVRWNDLWLVMVNQHCLTRGAVYCPFRCVIYVTRGWMTEEGLLGVGLFDKQSLGLAGSLPQSMYSTYRLCKKIGP
jgi:hypothetical protein